MRGAQTHSGILSRSKSDPEITIKSMQRNTTPSGFKICSFILEQNANKNQTHFPDKLPAATRTFPRLRAQIHKTKQNTQTVDSQTFTYNLSFTIRPTN